MEDKRAKDKQRSETRNKSRTSDRVLGRLKVIEFRLRAVDNLNLARQKNNEVAHTIGNISNLSPFPFNGNLPFFFSLSPSFCLSFFLCFFLFFSLLYFFFLLFTFLLLFSSFLSFLLSLFLPQRIRRRIHCLHRKLEFYFAANSHWVSNKTSKI